MIHLLTGPDDFSIREWLGEMKKTLGDPSLLSLNTARLEGKSLTPAELRGACDTAPFMSDKRLVIVSGLLGRYQPPKKNARPVKTARPAFNENECRAFGAAVTSVPQSTVLVLVDEEVSSTNPLFKLISAAAAMKSFPSLKADKLRQWITRRVAGEGGRISSGAIDLLARVIGGDLWIMSGEIAKLALFTSGRTIEEADVHAAVGSARETTIFALVDAILESRAGTSAQYLERLKSEGTGATQVLAMIARQARLIVLARELRNQGRSPLEMQSALGVAEFAVRKTLELAARYSPGRVNEVYRSLLEADIATKTGKYDGDLALNILIAELCQGRGRAPAA